MERFYLGTGDVRWLGTSEVPLFLSHRVLAQRKTFPRAVVDWSLDSGGFTELSMHGEWRITPDEYVEAVRRYVEEIGRMDWAAPQDWVCGPDLFAKTGHDVTYHQERTIDSVLQLRDMAPDLPWVPVLQGVGHDDYVAHVDRYEARGFDLEAEETIGIGSIHKQQATKEGERIVATIAGELGLALHGFGIKVTGVRKIGYMLHSADSLAWSWEGRRNENQRRKAGQRIECVHGGREQACYGCALVWRARLLAPFNHQGHLGVGTEAREGVFVMPEEPPRVNEPVSRTDTLDPDWVLDEELFREEERLSNADVRDPGLFPGFYHWHANALRSKYLKHLPGMINHLTSAWYLANTPASTMPDRVDGIPFARAVFVDSGAITPLVKCAKGLVTPADVRAWLDRQDDTVTMAWELAEQGTDMGFLGMMDVPAYPAGLEAAGMTKDEALGITIEHARSFIDAELPEGWRPVFIAQGPTVDEFLRCLDVFDEIGVLELAKQDKAWIAVGGTLSTRPPALYSIYRAVRDRVGPDAHIHALGVRRTEEIVHMHRRGWVNGCDSSSSAQSVIYNRGPYKIEGPRVQFLQEAMFAAQAVYDDAQLAKAIAKAADEPIFEQEALL